MRRLVEAIWTSLLQLPTQSGKHVDAVVAPKIPRVPLEFGKEWEAVRPEYDEVVAYALAAHHAGGGGALGRTPPEKPTVRGDGDVHRMLRDFVDGVERTYASDAAPPPHTTEVPWHHAERTQERNVRWGSEFLETIHVAGGVLHERDRRRLVEHIDAEVDRILADYNVPTISFRSLTPRHADVVDGQRSKYVAIYRTVEASHPAVAHAWSLYHGEDVETEIASQIAAETARAERAASASRDRDAQARASLLREVRRNLVTITRDVLEKNKALLERLEQP